MTSAVTVLTDPEFFCRWLRDGALVCSQDRVAVESRESGAMVGLPQFSLLWLLLNVENASIYKFDPQ